MRLRILDFIHACGSHSAGHLTLCCASMSPGGCFIKDGDIDENEVVDIGCGIKA
jgi:hypothetical protein